MVKFMYMTKIDIKSSNDATLERNTARQWEFLMGEYELIKLKKHRRFCFVQEFYNFYNVKRQNFIKYYNRYRLAKLNNCSPEEINKTLLPCRRGPKYSENRSKLSSEVIDRIKQLRIESSMNRYNLRIQLELEYKATIDKLPSTGTIYNIFRRYNINKLDTEMIGNSKRKEIKKIIKDNIGDMGHMDCHYLPKNIIENNFRDRYYLVGLIDDRSRIISLELSKDIQSVTVMFKALNMINFLRNVYNIEFKEVLTDNGSEFGGGREKKNKNTNPFERLLKELNIKHRYTKPYHPQTNGKIERLWRIINDELLDGMVFDSEEHLREELMKYVIYFNEYRAHSSLEGKTPKGCMEEEREAGGRIKAKERTEKTKAEERTEKRTKKEEKEEKEIAKNENTNDNLLCNNNELRNENKK
jgi:hypothetical protein